MNNANEPGEFTAVAYADGTEQARSTLTSAGAASRLRLSPEPTVRADDAVRFVEVLHVDAAGRAGSRTRTCRPL